MSTTPSTPVAPIALRRDDGEALWFLGFLATIKRQPPPPPAASR